MTTNSVSQVSSEELLDVNRLLLAVLAAVGEVKIPMDLLAELYKNDWHGWGIAMFKEPDGVVITLARDEEEDDES